MAATSCRACVVSPPNGSAWVWCDGAAACVLGAEVDAAACGLVVAGDAAQCPYDYGVPTILVIMQSFGGLCALLLIGHLLRANVRALRWLYMPASLLGGLVGVGILQLCYLSPDVAYYMQGWTVGWDELPGFLITLVFASMFMGQPLPNLPEVRTHTYTHVRAWHSGRGGAHALCRP
jgi:hypothetical protein